MQTSLSEQVQAVLRAENEAIIAFYREVAMTEGPIIFVPPEDEHVSLSILCLHDFAEVLQTVGRALDHATREWEAQEGEGVSKDQKALALAVHETRYHLDYCSIAVCAAANHLASSLWHLLEHETQPLGRHYKSAAQAHREWTKANRHPGGTSALASILDDPKWKVVNEHRDGLVHRELPLLAGELRPKRRQVWVQPTAPEPDGYLMKATAQDGRVAYLLQADHPDVSAPELIDACRHCLRALVAAGQDVLRQLQTNIARHGILVEQARWRVQFPSAQQPPTGSAQ